MKAVNSNSFEFNSNGFELGLEKRKVQKCRIFGRAPEYDKRIYGKVGDQELRLQRHWDILQVCYGEFQINEMFKYSSLILG